MESSLQTLDIAGNTHFRDLNGKETHVITTDHSSDDGETGWQTVSPWTRRAKATHLACIHPPIQPNKGMAKHAALLPGSITSRKNMVISKLFILAKNPKPSSPIKTGTCTKRPMLSPDRQTDDPRLALMPASPTQHSSPDVEMLDLQSPPGTPKTTNM